MKKTRPRLTAATVQIMRLAEEDRKSMYAIYEKYYTNVSYGEFQSDLSKKNAVIILREPSSQSIKGFSTILNMNVKSNGRNVNVIFSGDTIVEKEFWGQKALHREFVKYTLGMKLRNPFTPLYWFLISKGYKTYLLLANNFSEYYPRFDRETPPVMSDLITSFATSLYPKYYDASTGLIRFPYESAHLKSGVATIDRRLLVTNPKVAFFAETNPDWDKGTELACIGELSWHMPFRFIAKLVAKRFKSAAPSLPTRVAELDFVESDKQMAVASAQPTAVVEKNRDRGTDIAV